MKYWLLRRPFTPVAAISASTDFAKQYITRHQPAAGLSGIRDISLVYRRIHSPEEDTGYQEIHHHHHQRIEWKPQTHVSIVQPMLVRNHYFWRLLALEGRGSVAALPWSESERRSADRLSIEGLTSPGSTSGTMPSAMLQMLLSGDMRRLPSDVWLEAHMDQDERSDAALPLSLRVMGILPQLIFRQMAGGLGGIWTGGGAEENAYIQPYEWTLDTSSMTRLPGSVSRRRLRELTRLAPLIERSDSNTTRFGSGATNRTIPRFRWLPPVRLSVPVRAAPDRVRSEGERNIRRLSDLFQVSRLSELDNMLGGTYTVQLLNIWPSPEQTAAALPYPSWQPMRQEATRDPEDWLYHIVRLFNPHERRAVIEHNIRRLYQRAAERSFHQQAGRWSRLVMTSVRQEWRRQAPAGAPVAGLPEQFVRRQGNRWLWNQSALAGNPQWRQAGERLREWWPWLNLPWLQGDSGDESLRRELYHPLLLRRYLNEDEMGIGTDSDTRWLQGNIYEALGRYIERETLRLSPERFMMLLPLAAALPGQKGQRSSLRQLARERASQQLSGRIPGIPVLPAVSPGLGSGTGTVISNLVQRISGRELAQELLRTRSIESSDLALRLAQQDRVASVQSGVNSRTDLQLEASRWLLHAVQAEQRSNMSSLSTGSANGLSPERMLLAFRHSDSATSASVSTNTDGDSAYIWNRRSGEESSTATSTLRGLPLRGAVEPAMLELLRRRIQLLPERMLTGETEQQFDTVRRVESQRQEAFVPEWRRTKEPASASSAVESGSNRTSDRTSEGNSSDIAAALSGSESPLASRQPVRLGSAELEQIVQRVYRELQRRLKSDYQRRGM